MSKKIHKSLIISFIIFVFSCSNAKINDQAFGHFEADEITLSAEANGKIVSLQVSEGDHVKVNQLLGIIDTVQLALKNKQLRASMSGIKSKNNLISSQLSVLKSQRQTILKEQTRVLNLFKDNAATQKQVDDVNGAVQTLNEQIISAETQFLPVQSEIMSMNAQIETINDQIKKSYLLSPKDATVLVKYLNESEIVSYGKPILKIANMADLILRVYISGDQLAMCKLGEQVSVFVLEGNEDIELKGKISWISAKAEFTPKIIQTKNEQSNLVYAVKVIVPNNGSLKIGMPGEIKFKTN